MCRKYVPTHLPVNATGSTGAQHGHPALLCWRIQSSALAAFTLPKNEGLAVCTEMNPYGNVVSAVMLCRRALLFPSLCFFQLEK